MKVGHYKIFFWYQSFVRLRNFILNQILSFSKLTFVLEGTEDHIKNTNVSKQRNVNVKNKGYCFTSLPLREGTQYFYTTCL